VLAQLVGGSRQQVCQIKMIRRLRVARSVHRLIDGPGRPDMPWVTVGVTAVLATVGAYATRMGTVVWKAIMQPLSRVDPTVRDQLGRSAHDCHHSSIGWIGN
jgi:hypothetical protein